MEPTTNTATGAKSSKVAIIIVIIVIVIIGAMLALRNKTEAPTGDVPGALVENSQLEADVNGALNFDNEASLNAIDKEFVK